MIDIPDHAWRYLVALCKRERERLAQIEPLGSILPLMAAFDSLNEIECMIPVEHWPDHESRDVTSVRDMTITMENDHARTLAKLRVAVDALEAVMDTDGHQSYATQLSEACDIAHTALTQIKDEKP